MEVLSEEAVPAAEARNTMSKKKDEELSYEQKICLEFLEKNVKMNVTDARKAMKDLQKVGRIKPRQAAVIVNVQPKDMREVRLIFSKERMSLSEEEMEKIIEIMGKYTK